VEPYFFFFFLAAFFFAAMLAHPLPLPPRSAGMLVAAMKPVKDKTQDTVVAGLRRR
jgi:hypothetical protein